MTHTFVAALWKGFDEDRWLNKSVNDAKSRVPQLIKLNAVVYGYGPESHAVLTDLGLSPIALDLMTEAVKHQNGQFAMKIDAMHRCLTEYDSIVWLDLDVNQHRELPVDFWERLDDGPPIQACIQQYHRRKCKWRKTHPRTLQSAAFVYCRDLNITSQIIETMRDHPTWTEEIAMAFVIDEMMGGWIDPPTYRRAGYNPPWFMTGNAIFPIDNPLFIT